MEADERQGAQGDEPLREEDVTRADRLDDRVVEGAELDEPDEPDGQEDDRR